MQPSEPGMMTKEDWKRWAKNILIFSSPLLILFLTELQKGTDVKQAAVLVYAALINAVIDLLRKYLAGEK